MKHAIQLLSFLLAIVPQLQGGEVVWYPVYGSPSDPHVPVSSIAQVGSEAWIIVSGPGFIFDTSVPLPSERVNVEFPTLFVAGAIYSLEIPAKFGELEHVIYNSTQQDPMGEYDYDLGNEWIFHQKGTVGWEDPRHVKSLGWIYIRDYPWIYGLDWGWRYAMEAGISWNANAWWLYEPNVGWFWTTRDAYPWIFQPEQGWTRYSPSI